MMSPGPQFTVECEMTIGVTDAQMAAMREEQRAFSERIAEMLRPGMEAIDTACSTVIALGYEPSECVIEIERDALIERRTLKVLGNPCFEVAMEAQPLTAGHGLGLVIATTQRLIAWPAAR